MNEDDNDAAAAGSNDAPSNPANEARPLAYWSVEALNEVRQFSAPPEEIARLLRECVALGNAPLTRLTAASFTVHPARPTADEIAARPWLAAGAGAGWANPADHQHRAGDDLAAAPAQPDRITAEGLAAMRDAANHSIYRPADIAAAAMRNADNHGIYQRAIAAGRLADAAADAAAIAAGNYAARFLAGHETARDSNAAITATSNSNHFDYGAVNPVQNMSYTDAIEPAPLDIIVALPRILGWQSPAVLTSFKFEYARLSMSFVLTTSASNSFNRASLVRQFTAIFPSPTFVWALTRCSAHFTPNDNELRQTSAPLARDTFDAHIDLQFQERTRYQSVLKQIKIAKDAVDYLARLNPVTDTQLVRAPAAAAIAADVPAPFQPGKRRLLRLDASSPSAPQGASE
jgi:hypothetical protein